jgi:hypothetical protein
MFSDQKICLILDEFQTWFNSLPETENGKPVKANAFNFIQILSEIAKDYPEKLILVVSVLDSNNNAYTQIRRQNPVDIDFLGAEAKRERQKLLLHRLFNNRDNITVSQIEKICAAYSQERVRLRYPNCAPQEQERLQNEVSFCWPFSPELIELLEEQILVSRVAQDNRDLIKILALVFKSRGEQIPVITPADFYVDGQNDEVQTLINSIAAADSPDRLRKIAQTNLVNITNIAPDLKNAREMVSDIWMHSLFHDNSSGVEPSMLHLEITRAAPISDNDFNIEITNLIENSTHIFGDAASNRLIKFLLEENPHSKVRAFAKNENIWAANAVSSGSQNVYPGADITHIRDTLQNMFSPETRQSSVKIIILGPSWRTDPWSEVKDSERPENWDRPVLLAIPENIENGSEPMQSILGNWLKDALSRRRNTVRFLLTKNSLFTDKELLFLGRCAYLCSKSVWGTERSYSGLYGEYQNKLDSILKSRFDHFAVLHKWDYQNPASCVFETQKITAQGRDIPKTVEESLLHNFFDYAEFKNTVIHYAKNSLFIKDIIESFIEPSPPSSDVIMPYLEERKIIDLIFGIAASGEIIINVKGAWIGRRAEDADVPGALDYIRRKANEQNSVMVNYQLSLPGSSGGALVGAAKAAEEVNEAPLFPQYADYANTPSASDTHQAGVTSVPSQGGISTSPVIPADNGKQPAPVQVKIPRSKAAAPSSSINLIGQLELWDIAPEKTIHKATLEFDGLSATQLKQILQRIPPVYEAGLSISYDDISGDTGDDKYD